MCGFNGPVIKKSIIKWISGLLHGFREPSGCAKDAVCRLEKDSIASFALRRGEGLRTKGSLGIRPWKNEIGLYAAFWPIGSVEFGWEIAGHVPIGRDEDFLIAFTDYSRSFVADYIIEFIAVMGVCGDSFRFGWDEIKGGFDL